MENKQYGKRCLYIEALSGVSGDMFVASALDAGADELFVREQLACLGLPGYSVEIARTRKNSIDACSFDVIMDDGSHDHHQHAETPVHSHVSVPEYGHIHGHRNLEDIQIFLDRIADKDVAHLAKRIFLIVAEAEARAHGVKPEDVHFHEVGAIDSIVDIVAAAAAFVSLHVDSVVVTSLTDGTGHVHVQHGVVPVPVPAVLNICQMNGLPLQISAIPEEMVTPTGAAILAAITTSNSLPENYRIRRIGIGAGKKDFAQANILRFLLLDVEEEGTKHDTILHLETNIDDCTGEALGYTMDKLFEAAALDVYYTPVFMKKNRPGVVLSVICSATDRARLEAIIFRHTTSIGVRCQEMNRTYLPREIKRVQTLYGDLNVKEVTNGEETYCYPEYDEVAAVADRVGVSLQKVYEEAVIAWRNNK